MKRLALGVIATAFLVPAATLHSQERFDPREVQKADELFPGLKSDLRNYVVAQEVFFVDNNRYAGSIRSLAHSEFRYRTSPGVTVVLLTVSDQGHSAIAIHEELPDYACAIRVGNVPPPLNDGADEGEATCRWPG